MSKNNKFENIEYQITDKELVLKIDLSKNLGTSQRGKSIRVATTHGFQIVFDDGKEKVGINLNCNKY